MTMFAVIKTGGKQYRIAKDDILRVEKLDVEAGEKVEISDVLMVDDGKKPIIGTPLVSGAKVEATVMEHLRDRKVIIFKKKRRKNYRRRNGHRQHLTRLRIDSINPGSDSGTKSEATAS